MPDDDPLPSASPALPRIALVTGAARRIGRAVALDLAGHGFDVAVHCRRSHGEAEAVAAEIRARGRRAAVIVADLGAPEAAEHVLAITAERLGPVGLLVNNASIFEPDTPADLSPVVWDRQMAINLRAPILLASRFAEALPPQAEGVVINLLDQKIVRPSPRFFSYTLSKSALWSATQMMAQAYAPRIRVAAVGPGPTLASERQTAEDFDRLQASLPLGRGAGLDEITAAVRFILAARSLTGQMLVLDGGRHLAWETADARLHE